MGIYLITTHEHVEGTYVVQAGNELLARAKFSQPIDWEGVEQTQYMSFDVEIEKCISVMDS